MTRRLHVAFVSRSREQVDAFWHAGTKAGYASDGVPGPRPEYHEDYYGAFLIDPDGNSAEAVPRPRAQGRQRHRPSLDTRRRPRCDETLLRDDRADPAASHRERTNRAGFHVAARARSFALVRGEPSENVHIAFPVPDDGTVGGFHRVALAAGYRDNGPPGERRYHPGYYGAFVFDPDGNNIEAVHHNR